MKFSAIITFALISLTAAQSIQEQNANDAEKLTEDFKKLTPDSPCKDGDEACVQDQFAQCVGGKFALNSCGGGELKCVVLPLVNKSGTSITCSTEQDRLDRLAAARGKSPKEQPKGEENNIETPAESEPEPENGKNKDKDQPPESGKDDDNQPKQPQQSPKTPESGKGNENDPKIFRPQNADDAEKLTEDFKKLTPDSPCENGEQACVQDQFAQCVDGKFALNSCGGGELKCVVLPLVNKPGTSITCSTEQDRLNRLDEARGKTPSEPESGKGKDDNEQPSENGKGKDNNVNQPDSESPENEDDDEQPSDDNKDDGKGKEENNSNPKQPQPPKSPENGKGEDPTAVIRKKNAEEAEKLQKEFESFTPDQPCNNNEVACIDDKLAQCANGKFALTECGPGLQCFVLPLVLKEGTTVTCTTEADRDARLNEAKNNLK